MKKEFFAVEASIHIPEDNFPDVFILFFILFDTREETEKFLSIPLRGVKEQGEIYGRVLHDMRLVKANDVEDSFILDGRAGIIKAVVDEDLITRFSVIIYNNKTKDSTIGDALPMEVAIY